MLGSVRGEGGAGRLINWPMTFIARIEVSECQQILNKTVFTWLAVLNSGLEKSIELPGF